MREIELIAGQQRAKLHEVMGLGRQQALKGINETLDMKKTTPRGLRAVPLLPLRSASSSEEDSQVVPPPCLLND